jgi:hypothetical protein
MRHLDLALKRNAIIVDAGDLFCAMQGKYDKRSSKRDIRPEHMEGSYLDSLVSTAIDYYEPYAHLFAVLGHGNHETSIKDHHETDLTDRLAAGLRQRTGCAVAAGGYNHWVDFRIQRASERISRKLWWSHGYGGGGPVTQDMIQGQRMRAWVENADVMMSGHTHDSWIMDTVRIKLSQSGEIEHRTVYQVKLPTYKDEYGNGRGGFHIEKGRGPKPLGAYWMRLYWDGNRGVQIEMTRAM